MCSDEKICVNFSPLDELDERLVDAHIKSLNSEYIRERFEQMDFGDDEYPESHSSK